MKDEMVLKLKYNLSDNMFKVILILKQNNVKYEYRHDNTGDDHYIEIENLTIRDSKLHKGFLFVIKNCDIMSHCYYTVDNIISIVGTI